MADMPGVPQRFAVTEIQRQVPRTEPPSKPPKASETVVIERGAHGWKITAPVAVLVAAAGVFAGRQTAPPAPDPSQALIEMRSEMRAELGEIKREVAAIRENLRDRDNQLSNRLNAVEAKIAATH